MQTSILPNSISDKVDKFCLWGSSKGARKIPLVFWEHVIKSKDLGGLGSEAPKLLIKLIWWSWLRSWLQTKMLYGLKFSKQSIISNVSIRPPCFTNPIALTYGGEYARYGITSEKKLFWLWGIVNLQTFGWTPSSRKEKSWPCKLFSPFKRGYSKEQSQQCLWKWTVGLGSFRKPGTDLYFAQDC